MEERKKRFHIGAAIGYFLLACSPVLIFFALQMIAGCIVMIRYLVSIIGTQILMQQITDSVMLMEQVMDAYMEHVMVTSLIYQILALAVFGLWYYLAWGQKSSAYVRGLKGKSIVKIVVLATFFEVLTGGVLTIVNIYFPAIMEAYEALMEEAGLNEISILVMLAAVIMAPVVEELAFRGVTFRIGLHITGKNSLSDTAAFWVANILQALLFGIAHLNLVQGCYAFSLGIVMGCVIRKYKTIYASILFHAVFNFGGTVVTALLSLIPYMDTLPVAIVQIILSGIVCFIMYRMIKKDIVI